MNVGKQIKSKQVRLVGDNIEEPGIYSLDDALKKANEYGLDLCEVSPGICKIMDYQKYLYQQKKDAKKNKAVNKVETKEIRFSPGTDDNDFQTKVRQAQKFLEHKDKVKATIFFKGRSLSYTDKGQLLLLKFIESLSDYGKASGLPSLDGRRMTVIINPK